MKIITWNVNSVRSRLERVQALLDRHQPDVLCLQETKVVDDLFPHEAIAQKGYRAEVFGQKTYNGVAIITRQPAEAVVRGFDGDPVPEQARVIGGTVNGVAVLNLYVVNGKALDTDPYRIKLQWLDALNTWISKHYSPDQPLVICGDFNIAPDDRDVYDPEIWRDRLLVSDPERARLKTMLDWGTADLFRLNNDEGGTFSWWDYRAGSFPRNRGLRIDLLLGTKAVAERCTGVEVDREERKKTTGPGNASDHAPVIAHLSP